MSGRTDDVRSHSRLDPVTRRALLIEAASGVFRGRDPNEVSFEEVAEAGGVSRSLVYAYFGDRGGLIAAVYLHDLEQLDQDLGRALDDHLPDEVRLRQIIHGYLVYARDNEAAWNLMVAMSTLQHPAIQEARRARIERIARAWGNQPVARLVARSVVGFLEAGAQDWVDHRDLDIDAAVNVLFVALWDGLTGLQPGGPVGAEAAPR
jgi:AcrR family transcriptional regulator